MAGQFLARYYCDTSTKTTVEDPGEVAILCTYPHGRRMDFEDTLLVIGHEDQP